MNCPSQREQRRLALQARRALDAKTRATASQRISDRFLRSPLFHAADTFGCFFSMPDEVDTSDIFARVWRAGKRIYCPVVARRRRMRFVEVTRETRLATSAFGLLEPQHGDTIRPLDLDVVLVPLAAFDARGHRIGMGAGYYDRTFAALRNRQSWSHPKLVGLAFACQEVPKIKANPWDIPLFDVLTEND